MKIKSYLAILVVVSLIGGNGVRYLLSNQFDELSILTQQNADAQLWQKDFQRVGSDLVQYLISTDLVIGSGESYIAAGTLSKGKIIAREALILAESNVLLDDTADLRILSDDVHRINRFIQQAASGKSDDRIQELAVLLNTYDPIAVQVTRRFENLNVEIENSMAFNSEQLMARKTLVQSVELSIQGAFTLLVLASWVWAYRMISRPLQTLRAEVVGSSKGEAFKPVKFGPKEIQELSRSFSELTQSLSFQATHDPLTQLFNRRAFGRSMTEFLSQCESDGIAHALCFIDLDHFKTINDTCGHAAGDELLAYVARLLVKHVRTSDVVARLGGDEFAILLHQCTIDRAEKISNNIRDDIRDFNYHWKGNVYRIGASIGITEIHADSGLIEDMLNAADIACMQAKTSGRDVVKIFDSETGLVQKKRLEAINVNEIISALEHNRFELYRQEIVPLQENSYNGRHYEILLRMRDAQGVLINPSVFMPLVERYRLGTQVDRWVINAAIDWLSDNPKELESLDMCSINLSGQSVGCLDTRDYIADKLKDLEFPSHKLCFEVTETAAITDLECAVDLIAGLQRYGCRFALDDFGSGLSSFAYLKNLKVDFVKIDGVFVRDMLNSESDRATVKAINDVAKATGKQTIAEFVEDEAIACELTSLGIEFGQGYYFDKPKPLKMNENSVERSMVKS